MASSEDRARDDIGQAVRAFTSPQPPARVAALGKCAPCLDAAINAGKPVELGTVPDGVVLVTVVQQFAVGGQQIAVPVQMAQCVSCRGKQLGTVSKTGLALA